MKFHQVELMSTAAVPAGDAGHRKTIDCFGEPTNGICSIKCIICGRFSSNNDNTVERIQELESKANNLERSLSTLHSSISSNFRSPRRDEKGDRSTCDPSSTHLFSQEQTLHCVLKNFRFTKHRVHKGGSGFVV